MCTTLQIIASSHHQVMECRFCMLVPSSLANDVVAHTSPTTCNRVSSMHVLTQQLHSVLQVPVRIPPGMPAEQAAGIIEYLKANPEAAKAAWAQAQAIMQNPGLANAFVNMQVLLHLHCGITSSNFQLKLCSRAQ